MSEVRASSIARTELRRFAAAGYLFAIVDSTVVKDAIQRCTLVGPAMALSLFDGSAMEPYWAVAPYFFQVDRAALAWAESLYPKPWGVFVMSQEELSSLSGHLSRRLFATLPDGKQRVFRYYDPRVLKTYLSTLSGAALQGFFGPVRGWGVAETAASCSLFSCGTAPRFQERTTETVITPAQLEQFAIQVMVLVRERIVDHLRGFFSDDCERLGTERLTDLVEASVHTAAAYGIVAERDVVRFVDLNFILGVNFETKLGGAVMADVGSEHRLAQIYNSLESMELSEERKRAARAAFDSAGKSFGRQRAGAPVVEAGL